MQPARPELAIIEAAARHLEQGALVAFPTETVYGLGADAENPAAVQKIYAAKGRPPNHPVIVHLAPEGDVGRWTAAMPPEGEKLIEAFWPGPLTLILKRAPTIPDAVSGGQNSIGLRCPSHPVAQALLRAFRQGQGGVAAPSANRFGHVSPTTAQHVRDEFAHEPLVAAILDGGQSEVGIESTILDLSRLQDGIGPTLLRPGSVSAHQIADTIGIMPAAPTAAAPRASGTLEAHYAPRTPTLLVPADELPGLVASLARQGRRIALLAIAGEAPDTNLLFLRTMRGQAPAYAHDLYAALRDADHAGADLILVEAPPQGDAWNGVNDRLRRAAFSSSALARQFLGK